MSGRPHWLQTSGKTKTPSVIVSFDTETRVEVKSGAEVLTLRCWDALARVRSAGGDRYAFTRSFAGETATTLADALEAACSLGGEAWCFAHNAGFDLTVTSLPMVLAERGWQPEFVNISDETCVFVMTGERGRLVITDSWSWLRTGLQTAAADVGMRKTRLPEDDDTLAAWHHRCRHDVMILDRLLVELLDWWDRSQLGSFGVTGAACGWRSMRAKIPAKAILVGAEQPRTAFEREAVFGGRKEVWQVGRVRGRWVEDWDLASAYLTTVASLPLPTVPLNPKVVHRSARPHEPPEGYGAVARVKVTTRVPCAPVRLGDDVWWPVGEFVTVLTSPELAQVVNVADRIEVLDARWYELTDALRPWGQWCAWLQSQPDTVAPRVVKRVAKQWGRAVPGRFALRTSELIGERDATHLGWALSTGHDLDTGRAIEVVTYAGRERTYRKDVDGADVNPAVLAFVEGYVRAAMAETIAARDPASLLQCNTDGWWEVKSGRGASGAAAAVPAPYRAVRKASSRDVTVIGPNHMDSLGDRRLAGIPKDAKPTLDGGYAWHDWPGLRWQLQFSRPGEYRRPGREMLLADHYCRRWVLTSGETVPVSARLSQTGATELLPWSQTALRAPSDELAQWQVPSLQALADPQAPWAASTGAPGPPQPGRR